jgi:hypothetical protein
VPTSAYSHKKAHLSGIFPGIKFSPGNFSLVETSCLF